MSKLIRIEEVFLFFLSVYLFYLTGYTWWWFPVLLLAPDLAMAGYSVNTRVGAVIYNIFHHRALGIVLYISGSLAGISVLGLIGIILFAHSTLDRVFSFGLKYPDRFEHTHLSGREK
jgi:hypothetical protein